MILEDKVLPEQLGAFLMLLRVKEESAAEIAGFVKAVRKSLPPPPDLLPAVDWSSYAGKKRQLPWFLLAALCLASSGHAVFMHGFDGHTAGRLYTGDVLRRLGLAPVENFVAAAQQLRQKNFAYMDLEHISPPLARMMGFKKILGLRSPVHTHCADDQSAACALPAAGNFSSQLHDDPSRRGASARREQHGRFSRRGRRDRAAPRQTLRNPWDRSMASLRGALAARSWTNRGNCRTRPWIFRASSPSGAARSATPMPRRP